MWESERASKRVNQLHTHADFEAAVESGSLDNSLQGELAEHCGIKEGGRVASFEIDVLGEIDSAYIVCGSAKVLLYRDNLTTPITEIGEKSPSS